MRCEEIREMMPDLASGLVGMTPEIGGHLAGCGACTGKLEEVRQTMAVLDQWQAPEPGRGWSCLAALEKKYHLYFRFHLLEDLEGKADVGGKPEGRSGSPTER